MKYPQSIQSLIDQLSLLPSVGPRTAERYVFFLLRQNPEYLQTLAQAIAELKEKTLVCNTCFAIASSSPCRICSDKKRDLGTICVVANSRDQFTLEATNEFNGLYHVLGGLIDTIENIKPEQLKIKSLVDKLKTGSIKEVILALNPTIEGESTIMYLTKTIKPFRIKITRLAKGLPMGSDMEYADEITLANALKFRNTL